MLPIRQHSHERQNWTWQRAGITRIPLLNVRGVSPSPFLSQGTGLRKDSWRFCVFLDSVNSGIKGVFLVLAMGGKYSDNFCSDNCSTPNQSSSHMFSFGLQSTLFTLSSLLISFYILCTLFIDIRLSSCSSFAPNQASALLSFTYRSYVSPTYHHSSLSNDPQSQPQNGCY